jgi:hypothetical protein
VAGTDCRHPRSMFVFVLTCMLLPDVTGHACGGTGARHRTRHPEQGHTEIHAGIVRRKRPRSCFGRGGMRSWSLSLVSGRSHSGTDHHQHANHSLLRNRESVCVSFIASPACSVLTDAQRNRPLLGHAQRHHCDRVAQGRRNRLQLRVCVLLHLGRRGAGVLVRRAAGDAGRHPRRRCRHRQVLSRLHVPLAHTRGQCLA